MKRIALTTGGTGGHIYPALALAKEMRKKGYEVIFIGTSHRMEKEIVPKEKFKFYGLDILPFSSIKAIIKGIKAVFEIRKILKNEKIDTVVGFGNYISIPTILSAKLLGLNIYLQEQNIVMGKANKYCLPFAKKIFLAFGQSLEQIKNKKKCVVTGNPLRQEFYNITKEDAREILGIPKKNKVVLVMGKANKYCLPFAKKIFLAFGQSLEQIKNKKKCVVTGNPLRQEFYNITKEDAREILGIPKKNKVVLVMGGSLGAKVLNEAIIANIEYINKKKDFNLYWSTGESLYKESMLRIKDFKNIIVMPYFENVYEIMAASDLVICRSGASTISELLQLEKPAIFIPYDFVGQKENAEMLEYANAAKSYSNEEAKNAVKEALALCEQQEMLDFMKGNIKELNPGNAINNILKEMEDDAK